MHLKEAKSAALAMAKGACGDYVVRDPLGHLSGLAARGGVGALSFTRPYLGDLTVLMEHEASRAMRYTTQEVGVICVEALPTG